MHNKLQGEKSRLALAVQACEAATASISRPGTPGSFIDEGPSAPIPQRELEVRAKLEDLIDQVSSKFSLTKINVVFLCTCCSRFDCLTLIITHCMFVCFAYATKKRIEAH